MMLESKTSAFTMKTDLKKFEIRSNTNEPTNQT